MPQGIKQRLFPWLYEVSVPIPAQAQAVLSFVHHWHNAMYLYHKSFPHGAWRTGVEFRD